MLAIRARARHLWEMLRLSICIALALSFTGCVGEQDPASLGRFKVEATLTESCAETGLLAAPAERSFVVHLRRVSDHSMHWNDGEDILYCSLGDDGRSFTAERHLQVDVRADDPADKPPCEIDRIYIVEGELRELDGKGFPNSFVGSTRYEYTPAVGSSCDDLLQGSDAIAASLPCAVGYDLDAELLQR